MSRIFFLGSLINESERGTNKAHEPRNRKKALILVSTILQQGPSPKLSEKSCKFKYIFRGNGH